MDYKSFGTFKCNKPMGHYESGSNESGTWTKWVQDKPIEGRVEVLIDIDAIVRQLGPKALKSKGGKAIEIGGLVVIKKLSLQEVA